MKAIILAAGYGTRLRPLTDKAPKPLMPILGKPLLWYSIMKLISSKATGIGINLHHHAEMIQAFIEAQSLPIYISRSYEREILGSGGGLRGLRQFIGNDDYFIVHNGDVLSSIPIAQIFNEAVKRQPLCALVVHSHHRFNNVMLAPDGAILDIRNRFQPHRTGQKFAYTGIAIMHRRIFGYIPDGFSDIIEVLLKILRQGNEHIIGIAVEDHAWSDIGTPADYLRAHHDILVKRSPLIEAEYIPNEPTIVGQNTVVAEDVQLGGFVSIGENCNVLSGCRLQNCVIWDGTTIKADTILKNAVVGNGWVVPILQ